METPNRLVTELRFYYVRSMEETSESGSAKNDSVYLVITHLMPLAVYFVPAIGFIVAPLIWWAAMKDKYPEIDVHGKEVINFVISYSIYMIISVVLMFALIGFALVVVVAIASLIFTIIGAVKAGNNELYRYPMIMRFLS